MMQSTHVPCQESVKFQPPLLIIFVLFLLYLPGVTSSVNGQPAPREDAPDGLIAVASNFAEPARKLAVRFHETTDYRVQFTLGGTGRHFTQIMNGAPFDAFLAADAERPRLLERNGTAVEGSRFVYASGRLVLWSRQPGLPLGNGGGLVIPSEGRLAIAKPELSPYGLAAREALVHLGVWEEIQSRLVFGENISQTFHFVHSGNAPSGFVALSQFLSLTEGERGSHVLVPESHHQPIVQEAVLLTDNPHARAFLDFMKTPEAHAIIRDHGYDIPATETDIVHREVVQENQYMISRKDLTAFWITIKLAATTTVLLLMVGVPIAWWLARSRNRFKVVIETVVALPLVLPPTVLGFYLLLFLGPNGPFGMITGETLVFSFTGLVIASMVYSMPFVIQPLRDAFLSISDEFVDAAATLGASSMDRFLTIILPLARPGFLTATVLGFAHTMGEFGVALMIGGSIPGRTKVVSIAIFDHVETLSYRDAHLLSAILLIFSFVTILTLYTLNGRIARVGGA